MHTRKVDHANRQLARFQRSYHGRAPGDRWQDPVWAAPGTNRCPYVFTTGGIGPTDGDITADCVAKAFGVAIDSEGDIGMQLDEIAKANPAVAIGSSRFFDPQHGPNTNVVLRASDAQKPNAQSRHA